MHTREQPFTEEESIALAAEIRFGVCQELGMQPHSLLPSRSRDKAAEKVDQDEAKVPRMLLFLKLT